MSETKTVRKVYSAEFKKETLALVNEQGCTVKEAAEAAGIQDQLIYKWQKALDEATNGETLKKASAFFAKHMK